MYFSCGTIQLIILKSNVQTFIFFQGRGVGLRATKTMHLISFILNQYSPVFFRCIIPLVSTTSNLDQIVTVTSRFTGIGYHSVQSCSYCNIFVTVLSYSNYLHALCYFSETADFFVFWISVLCNVKYHHCYLMDYLSLLGTCRKLNVHKMFRKRSGRFLNVLCTFSLLPVSSGKLIKLNAVLLVATSLWSYKNLLVIQFLPYNSLLLFGLRWS